MPGPRSLTWSLPVKGDGGVRWLISTASFFGSNKGTLVSGAPTEGGFQFRVAHQLCKKLASKSTSTCSGVPGRDISRLAVSLVILYGPEKALTSGRRNTAPIMPRGTLPFSEVVLRTMGDR